MKHNAQFELIEHSDVRGTKKLLYLKITVGIKDVFINIGIKTFNALKDLTNEKLHTEQKASQK